MTDRMITLCQLAASTASIAMMGAFGIALLARLLRIARGGEQPDGLSAGRKRPAVCAADMAIAALTALVSRVLVYLIAWGLMRAGGQEGGFFESLERLWLHWDTRHYIGIAEEGYVTVGDERLRLVFFPLYPLLMRVFSVFTGGDVFYGGLLVSLLSTMGASALMWDLGMMHGGRRTAALCVGYFLLSPMSVFLNCAYTEALFLFLTMAALCLFRRGHPWLAAVFGALSALTRMPGVIIAGLFIIALLGRVFKKQADAKAAAACAAQVLIVFSGLFIYWGINYLVTGDPLTYLVYQRENWFQEAGSFWQSASTTVYYLLTCVGESDWFFSWVTQMIAMFAVYALLLLRGKRLPFDLAAYSFVYVAVVLSPTWLLSAPRYLYALCALPLLKAKMTEKPAAHGVLLLVSAMLLVLYTYGYTIAVAVL